MGGNSQNRGMLEGCGHVGFAAPLTVRSSQFSVSLEWQHYWPVACVGVSVCARGGMDATACRLSRVAAQAVACMRVLQLQLASARAAVRARDWSPRVAGHSVILRALPHTA